MVYRGRRLTVSRGRRRVRVGGVTGAGPDGRNRGRGTGHLLGNGRYGRYGFVDRGRGRHLRLERARHRFGQVLDQAAADHRVQAGQRQQETARFAGAVTESFLQNTSDLLVCWRLANVVLNNNVPCIIKITVRKKP